MDSAVEITLSPRYQKILEVPELFYEYLKDNYGIKSTEKRKLKRSTTPLQTIKSIDLSLPDFVENPSPELRWYIELQESEVGEVEGVIYPSNKRIVFFVDSLFPEMPWSCIMHVETCPEHSPTLPDSEPKARCKWAIADSVFYEIDSSGAFNVMSKFLNILRDFLEHY